MTEKAKPIFKTQRGRISCAVWENAGTEGTYHMLTMERSYKDGDQYKTANNFNLGGDLDALERCLFEVKVWQALQAQK